MSSSAKLSVTPHNLGLKREICEITVNCCVMDDCTTGNRWGRGQAQTRKQYGKYTNAVTPIYVGDTIGELWGWIHASVCICLCKGVTINTDLIVKGKQLTERHSKYFILLLTIQNKIFRCFYMLLFVCFLFQAG